MLAHILICSHTQTHSHTQAHLNVLVYTQIYAYAQTCSNRLQHGSNIHTQIRYCMLKYTHTYLNMPFGTLGDTHSNIHTPGLSQIIRYIQAHHTCSHTWTYSWGPNMLEHAPTCSDTLARALNNQVSFQMFHTLAHSWTHSYP